MQSDELKLRPDSAPSASRRKFLKSVATSVLLGPPVVSGILAESKEVSNGRVAERPHLLYIGTYSSPSTPGSKPGRGRGIYLFEMDPASGALKERKVIVNSRNPSWVALNPSKTRLYSCDELQEYGGKASGAVTAYSINSSNGDLAELNTVSSEGAGPAYISVHPSGRYVLVANYAGGSIAVLPIHRDGSLGSATDVHKDTGSVGPKHAVSAPAGSFAISGHSKPHAHMIQADPTAKRVISTDLGMDRILIWNFDVERGTLRPNNPHEVPVPPGDGPRHFVFHPNGHWFYCIQEEGSAVVAFDYNPSTGNMTQKQVISTLPKTCAGTNMASEIRISPDARFIYGANRLHDTITTFAIRRDGRLEYAGEEWTHGDYPRSITIDPSGDFIYSCNQFADNVTAFRVNHKTGQLSFTGQYTPVGTPAVIVFLT